MLLTRPHRIVKDTNDTGTAAAQAKIEACHRVSKAITGVFGLVRIDTNKTHRKILSGIPPQAREGTIYEVYAFSAEQEETLYLAMSVASSSSVVTFTFGLATENSEAADEDSTEPSVTMTQTVSFTWSLASNTVGTQTNVEVWGELAVLSNSSVAMLFGAQKINNYSQWLIGTIKQNGMKGYYKPNVNPPIIYMLDGSTKYMGAMYNASIDFEDVWGTDTISEEDEGLAEPPDWMVANCLLSTNSNRRVCDPDYELNDVLVYAGSGVVGTTGEMVVGAGGTYLEFRDNLYLIS